MLSQPTSQKLSSKISVPFEEISTEGIYNFLNLKAISSLVILPSQYNYVLYYEIYNDNLLFCIIYFNNLTMHKFQPKSAYCYIFLHKEHQQPKEQNKVVRTKNLSQFFFRGKLQLDKVWVLLLSSQGKSIDFQGFVENSSSISRSHLYTKKTIITHYASK